MLLNQLPAPKPEPTLKVSLGNGLYATIDESKLDLVSGYNWKAEQFKCSFYAVAKTRIKGRIRKIRMHRLIAQTPRRQVCHHLNHNTLDNRRQNLLNMTPNEHMIFHSNNSIRFKFQR